MCGIVGYVGEKSAESILIEGLRRLEYRGYDSAGVAFLENGNISVSRAEGKLDNLVKKLASEKHTAKVGIGHTRWATHGKPIEKNAHPHASDDVVLVHNGIIENYAELKQNLVRKNFVFKSDTDTEVVAHLLQDALSRSRDFVSAFRDVLSLIRGAFSLVILYRKEPDKIYVAKRGSPLVVGKAAGESFVASDIPALLSYTREMIFLEDGEMAILSPQGLSFFTFEGQPIHKEVKIISWNAAQAEKGGYKHFMLKEIHEQPRALTDTMVGRVNRDVPEVDLGEANFLLEDFLKKPDAHIHIVACGTSWHAGLIVRQWIELLVRVPVNVELASEFRYRKPIVGASSLVIPISQSGETADTLAAVTDAKAAGAKILSVCNVVEASIPRMAHATLYTHAGPEIGVASTKAFTTQLVVLYLLALKMAQVRKTLSEKDLATRLESLMELPALCEKFLGQMDFIRPWSEAIAKAQHCYFLGRGLQYPVVLEGALKLKEISYIHAEGYPGGEMKHGPIALIEEGIPVVALALADELREKMISNIREVEARGARTFALVSQGDELLENYPDAIQIPKTHPDLMPLLTVLPLQLLAYTVADRKGTDVDQPRNLAKSVTVE